MKVFFLSGVFAVLIMACKPTSKNTETMKQNNSLLPTLEQYMSVNLLSFDGISEERKSVLNDFSKIIFDKIEENTVNINFICTHNSRRSHMGQLWAQAASHYYGFDNVICFSGGTEATAFNPRAVKAMQNAGFEITTSDTSSNPVYDVKYAESKEIVKAFSKKYNDDFNPQSGFIALMTCNHANEACPIVYGADKRIAVTYIDPKVSDNTPQEEAIYAERCMQIANEMFYVFSKIKEGIYD